MYRIILIIFLAFSNMTYSQIDSTWIAKKDKIIIPFKLINNLIVINVKLNDIDLKMILDTGSDINLLFKIPEDEILPINEGRTTSIIGIGSEEPIEAIISSNNEFKIEEYRDNNTEIVIINQDNINLINKFGVEINGIIGYSFFKNRIVELNYANEKIVVYKNRESIRKSKLKRFSKETITLINKKPYIIINSVIDSKVTSLKLLLDSGLSDGLWLFKFDSIKNNNTSIDDILGQGLSGDVLGKRTRIDKINFSKFSFNDILVSFPDSIHFKNIDIVSGRNGSIGGELLKKFYLIIDYEQGKIFFKKNKNYSDPFNYNMSGVEVRHSGKEIIEEKIDLNKNSSIGATDVKDFGRDKTTSYKYKYILKSTYEITSIRKYSPAYYVDLKIGDKIISINNKKAHYFTIQKITDLFQSEDGKKIKLQVEREGKIIEVIFYLKKLI